MSKLQLITGCAPPLPNMSLLDRAFSVMNIVLLGRRPIYLGGAKRNTHLSFRCVLQRAAQSSSATLLLSLCSFQTMQWHHQDVPLLSREGTPLGKHADMGKGPAAAYAAGVHLYIARIVLAPVLQVKNLIDDDITSFREGYFTI